MTSHRNSALAKIAFVLVLAPLAVACGAATTTQQGSGTEEPTAVTTTVTIPSNTPTSSTVSATPAPTPEPG